MLTVAEAAKTLGISEGRTRALISSGMLKALKRGRQWMIFEKSVEERIEQNAHAGRPRKTDGASKHDSDPTLNQAYSLYLACRDQVSQGGITSLVQNSRTAEERDFYVCLFNFFLNKKCDELVGAGVF